MIDLIKKTAALQNAAMEQCRKTIRSGMWGADRNFYGFELWKKASGTGAELLWRIKMREQLVQVINLQLMLITSPILLECLIRLPSDTI